MCMKLNSEVHVNLGVSLGFNPSIAFGTELGEVLFAVSQERMNNEKNTREFPFDAILKFVEETNLQGAKVIIDKVAYSHWRPLSWEEIEKYTNQKFNSALAAVKNLKGFIDFTEEEFFYILLKEILKKSNLKVEMYEIGLADDFALRIEHHRAHAMAAFAFYEKEEEMVIVTADGFGDGISMRIEDEKIMLDFGMKDSIALIYQFVTGALGFKEHQHEGKITGLAAFGLSSVLSDFERLYSDDMKIDLAKLDELSDEEQEEAYKNSIYDFEHLLRLKKTIYRMVDEWLKAGVAIENIAASVQELAENVVIDRLVKYANIRASIPGGDKKITCLLSGGLFANVKINQKIRETGLFKSVKVVPPMGDEGTAIGALLFVSDLKGLFGKTKKVDTNLNLALLGTSFDDDEIVQILESSNFEFEKISNEKELASRIANELSNQKIVCLCRGNMEFGPRALCNRTIMYDCSDFETNRWLNEQLGRTEFMPFAPVCRSEVAKDLFVEIEGYEETSRFMTMTFDCTDEMKKDYPAAVHVDGTARPQIVFEQENPFVWDVLDCYESITNKKALINTSFNIHNYPIIENPKIAFESWRQSNTDVLIMNDYFVKKRKEES